MRTKRTVYWRKTHKGVAFRLVPFKRFSPKELDAEGDALFQILQNNRKALMSGPPPTVEILKKKLQDFRRREKSEYWLLYVGDTMVGMAMLYMQRRDKEGKISMCPGFSIDPAWQRKGIGLETLTFLLERAFYDWKCQFVFSEFGWDANDDSKTNIGSQRLHEMFGFTPVVPQKTVILELANGEPFTLLRVTLPFETWSAHGGLPAWPEETMAA